MARQAAVLPRAGVLAARRSVIRRTAMMVTLLAAAVAVALVLAALVRAVMAAVHQMFVSTVR